LVGPYAGALWIGLILIGFACHVDSSILVLSLDWLGVCFFTWWLHFHQKKISCIQKFIVLVEMVSNKPYHYI
ncbi:hypothetical protein ACYTX7_09935, partial [Streptococcus pyogenes]